MKVLDLGARDTEVLLFGGPYSNIQAVNALHEQADARGIQADAVICTGDVVAYCGNPVETVQAVRNWGCSVVAGNCEQQLAAGAMNCGCGFAEGSTCDVLSAGWFAHADKAVQQEARAWMGSLPDMLRFTHHGLRCAVIHGGISDISRFLWSVSDEDDFAHEIGLITAASGPVDMVISGHSGIAFQREVGGVVWVNAGVIGMPPNDGGVTTEYAVLSNGAVSLQRLSYDHLAARNAMEVAGLLQGYHAALESGYWPSEEVLPWVLRRSG